MRLDELIDILKDVSKERGNKEIHAGQITIPEGGIVLTVIIPNGQHAPVVVDE